MLSEEQIKKLISANNSLQVQLNDANATLLLRNEEIDYLNIELLDASELRSALEGQIEEIKSMRNQLGEKQRAVAGAENRVHELHMELTELAQLKKQYNELLQDYAYLQSQFKDIRAQLTTVNERNFNLQQACGHIAELESRLEIALIERSDLKEKITMLETQKYLKAFNL